MFLDHTQRRTTVDRTPLDELIARPEESYRLWCVIVCDLETSRICTPYIYDISHLRVNGHLRAPTASCPSTETSVNAKGKSRVLNILPYLICSLYTLYVAELWVSSYELCALESVVAAASSDAPLHAVCVLYLQGTSSTSFVRRRSRGCRKVSVLTELWRLLKDSLNIGLYSINELSLVIISRCLR
jgi:hypothetical protein